MQLHNAEATTLSVHRELKVSHDQSLGARPGECTIERCMGKANIIAMRATDAWLSCVHLTRVASVGGKLSASACAPAVVASPICKLRNNLRKQSLPCSDSDNLMDRHATSLKLKLHH